MKRIAVIEDGYVRDTQIFSANPEIIGNEPDWEDNFRDVGYPCLYLGIFEGVDETEIKNKAAAYQGVHLAAVKYAEFMRNFTVYIHTAC